MRRFLCPLAAALLLAHPAMADILAPIPSETMPTEAGQQLGDFVTILGEGAADGPHIMTVAFADSGHAGGMVSQTVLSSQEACVRAGASALRAILLVDNRSNTPSVSRTVPTGRLNVNSFRHWVVVTCEGLQ